MQSHLIECENMRNLLILVYLAYSSQEILKTRFVYTEKKFKYTNSGLRFAGAARSISNDKTATHARSRVNANKYSGIFFFLQTHYLRSVPEYRAHKKGQLCTSECLRELCTRCIDIVANGTNMRKIQKNRFIFAANTNIC